MKKLNNTQIENAGVDAVSDYFNFTDTLDPSIPKKDKEPVWDGKLYLYKNGSDKQSRTGLIGIIPVQVKGRQFKDFSKPIITFSVNVNDVKLYQNNGGVSFFVVYVNAETLEKKIYYRLLAPIELRKIAKIAGKKKKISIEFKELPDSGKMVELEFLDFYNDCLKQHSVSNQEPIYFKDVENDITSINVQFSSQSDNHFEALQHFTSNAHFCYVTLKGDPTNTPHPLGEGRFNFKAHSKADVPVFVGDKQYFDNISCEIEEGKGHIIIGDCLRIPFTKDPNEIGKLETLNINVSFKTLSQRLRNYEFLLAIEENPIIKFGDSTIKIEKMSINYEMKRMHEADKNLQFVFNKLHVTEDLDITKVTDSEIKIINTLIDHYIYGKRVIPENDVDHQFIRLEIGNIVLMFLAEKVEDPNLYKLHSVHDLGDFFFSTENDKGCFILMPPFFVFNTEAYRDINNISYETFVDECNRYKSNDNRFYQGINWAILRMLNAYDQQKVKKTVLIDTVKELNQWLIDNDPDNNTTFVHALNKLQIIKRIRPLSDEDKEMLYEYMDSDKASDEVKFACYTLLNDKYGAARFFKKLPKEKQMFYKTMPIYTLFTTIS